MSLQTAFNTTRTATSTTAAQIGVVSRNISSASDAGYASRTALLEDQYDGVRVMGVRRAAADALQSQQLSAASASAGDQARQTALDQIHVLFGDSTDASSPAARASALQASLVQAVNNPSSVAAAQQAVSDAKNLAQSLNAGAQTIASVRSDLDAQMSDGVTQVNALLKQYDAVNRQIILGTASGADVNDPMDRRDAIVQNLSQWMGVSVRQESNGGQTLYADSGAVLYQNGPRTVSMQATPGLGATQTGAPLCIDGAPATGAGAAMALRTGKLAGLAQARDVDAPKAQAGLDAIAGSLISAFSETAQTAGTTPATRMGLFSWSGGPALPTASDAMGLSQTIAVDPAVDFSAGGDLQKLRDGGIGGAGYVYNVSGAASYSDRLKSQADAMSAAQSVDPSLSLGAQVSPLDLARRAQAAFEANRQNVTNQATQSQALSTHATSALTSATGVSIDDQMTQMLELERSYQAAAKLISAIGTMYDNFFAGIR